MHQRVDGTVQWMKSVGRLRRMLLSGPAKNWLADDVLSEQAQLTHRDAGGATAAV
jgi:hypothetical protein